MGRLKLCSLAAALALVNLAHATAHDVPAAPHDQESMNHRSSTGQLPIIGRAPDFDLVSQDSRHITLEDFRGRVVVIDFIYTHCPDTCPMLTANLVQVEDALGPQFGRAIAFVSITVDPLRDTPDVLASYANTFGISSKDWVFLTGEPATVDNVALRYGVVIARTSNADPIHNLLTSIIDGNGMLRVQYSGYSFDPEEFKRDLLSLVGEAK